MTRKDSRRKGYFDTPGNSSNDDSDDAMRERARRKTKRHRRSTVDPSERYTSEFEGFRYASLAPSPAVQLEGKDAHSPPARSQLKPVLSPAAGSSSAPFPPARSQLKPARSPAVGSSSVPSLPARSHLKPVPSPAAGSSSAPLPKTTPSPAAARKRASPVVVTRVADVPAFRSDERAKRVVPQAAVKPKTPLSASLPMPSAKESNTKRKQPVKEVNLPPVYPDTSSWQPSIPDDGSPAELNLVRFLKQFTTHEVEQCARVYGAAHPFLQERIGAVCKNFVSVSHDRIVKQLDERGALKKPKALPNAMNNKLRERESIWRDVLEKTRAELCAWDQLKDRSLTSPPDEGAASASADADLAPYREAIQIFDGQDHARIHKGFVALSLNLDSLLLSAQDMAKVFKSASDTQDAVSKAVKHMALEPYQKIANTKTLISTLTGSRHVKTSS